MEGTAHHSCTIDQVMNLISVRKKLNGHKDKFYLYDSLLTIKKIGGAS